jgi:hypothetical protein
MLAALVGGAMRWSTAGAQPALGCVGDEQVLLTPSTLRVGEPLLVTAFSWYPHT